MGIIKTAYKEEVQQWLIANLGEVFDKYIFIEVFVKVWDRAVKVEHAIRGFKLSGIYLLNPAKVKMGKLAPSSLYTKQDQLPDIANESFMNEPEGIVADANVAKIPQPNEAVTPMKADGNGMKKWDEPQPLTSQVIQDIKEDFKKPMVIVIGKKRFKLTEVEDEDNKGDTALKYKKSMINEILKLPEVKEKKWMGGAQMQGLPPCVSNEQFWVILKAKEDKKKKEEEKLKHKQELEAKAKAKRLKKQKKEAWKGLKGKCVVCKWVQVQDDSSSEEDSDKVILDDSSEADSEGDESDFYNEGTLDQCAKCGQKFVGAERCNVIGCDTEYCHHWYHPRCTNFDYKGKTVKQIRQTPWVCKYC